MHTWICRIFRVCDIFLITSSNLWLDAVCVAEMAIMAPLINLNLLRLDHINMYGGPFEMCLLYDMFVYYYASDGTQEQQ